MGDEGVERDESGARGRGRGGVCWVRSGAGGEERGSLPGSHPLPPSLSSIVSLVIEASKDTSAYQRTHSASHENSHAVDQNQH